MNLASFSMKWRIILPVTVIVALLFIITSTFNAVSLKKTLEQESQERAKEVAAHFSEQIGGFINQTSSSLHALRDSALNFRKLGTAGRTLLSESLKINLPSHPRSVGIWFSCLPNAFDKNDEQNIGSNIADKTGRLNIWWTQSKGEIKRGEPSSFQDEENEDYFKLSRETRRDQLIDPYLDDIDGQKVLMTSLTLPVMDEEQYIGTFGIDLSLAEIQKTVNSISPYTGSTAYLLSSSEKYISHPDPSKMGQAIEAELKISLNLSQNANTRTQTQFDQNGYFYQLSPITFNGVDKPWYLLLRIPQAVLKETLNRSIIMQVIATAISIAIITLLILLLITRITKTLYLSTTDLKESSQLVAQTADGLSQTSQELSSTTNQQAASVEETTASLEEISGMVSNNVQNAEEAFNLASEVKVATEKGSSSMLNLQAAMDKIKQSNAEIEALVHMIEAIADKTAIMDDIVFQTKLLSFNASVEAERAGEHGRGFAVVAQEVGNLAQLTGKSAQEIASIVKEGIDGTKKITSDNNQRVKEGDQYALEVAEHFRKIKDASEIVAQRSRQVLEASKEQSAGVKQINIAMGQVDKANQINSSKADETANSSLSLEKQSQRLEEIVEEITEIIEGNQHKP